MNKNLGNYEAQSQLLSNLKQDKELVDLIKGGFHNRVANKTFSFPRLVYTEINNIPIKYADNKEVKAEVRFQLSIFTDSKTIQFESSINKKIDEIMKGLFYKKYDSQSLYETDTELHHKALRYKKNFQ